MKYSIETYKDNIALINVDNEKGLKATLVSFGAGVYELSFNKVYLVSVRLCVTLW